ncbi:hypothetical protein MKW94_007619, partial [Papaver nudicaule]|nr:hypothetical protein [Papaver nudicaule]
EWTINGVLHDFTSVAGSGAAALFSGIHGFNTGIPCVLYLRWILFAIPSVLLISAASATLGAGSSPSYVSASSCLNFGRSRFEQFLYS